MKKLFSYFIKGIIGLIPFILTYYILIQVINIINDIIKNIYTNVDKDFQYYLYILTILVIALITYIGYLIDKHQNSFVLKLLEQITIKLPVIKNIYNIFKDITKIFDTNGKENYLGVIEIMFANYKTYAFLTKEEGEQYIAFVPTAPNPTSGYVIVLDKNKEVKEEIKNYGEWQRINVSSTEAMRKIISLGIN